MRLAPSAETADLFKCWELQPWPEGRNASIKKNTPELKLDEKSSSAVPAPYRNDIKITKGFLGPKDCFPATFQVGIYSQPS